MVKKKNESFFYEVVINNFVQLTMGEILWN